VDRSLDYFAFKFKMDSLEELEGCLVQKLHSTKSIDVLDQLHLLIRFAQFKSCVFKGR